MAFKRLIIWSIIGTGISSVTTQLLTVREFLSQFHGNEITISLVLFSWLLLTGLGSLAAKPVRRVSPAAYSLLLLTCALMPLAQLLAVRGFRELLFVHGSAPGFYRILSYIGIIIAPYCFLSGFVLPCALRAMRAGRQPFTSGDVYLTDSIGDIAGGALFSFVLVYRTTPFGAVAVSSSLLILTALLLLKKGARFLFLAPPLFLCLVFFFYSMNRPFERRTLSPEYGNIVRYQESPYGRIVVSREGNQYTLWESGQPLYSGADPAGTEEKVHYPLSQLDRVRDVLLVSGGLGRTPAEIARYGRVRVDYVELDPHLTAEALAAGIIRRTPLLRIIHADGRRFIRTTPRRYDAIIMDLPEPDTFQVNRFFTREFFALAKSRLKKNGILSFGIEYAPNYISEVRQKKLSTLYNTVRAQFRNVRILPGEKAWFLCRDGRLWTDIPARLKEKSIRTTYIEGYFYGNVTDERIRDLEKGLDRKEFINTDFAPRLINITFREWFLKHGASPGCFVAALAFLAAVYFILMRREEYVLFSTGFAAMGAEMLVVFAFQVLYGYIYLQIGAIVTAFLLGLLPGAVMGNMPRRGRRGALLVSDGALLSLLALFLVWVAGFRYAFHPGVFLAYGFLFSMVCGFQFPVAAGVIGERDQPLAGCLAADLWGAAAGTLVTGAILIPLWGIQSAVIFLILMKISSTMVIVWKGRRA